MAARGAGGGGWKREGGVGGLRGEGGRGQFISVLYRIWIDREEIKDIYENIQNSLIEI